MRQIGLLLAVMSLATACGRVTSPSADGGVTNGNQAPTDILLVGTSIEEQAAPGTLVGTLTAVDPDQGDVHVFELTDDAGGLFALRGADLVVADDAVINYEAAAVQTVEVTATDSASESVSRSVDIDIEDLREVVNTLDQGEGSLRQAIADALPGETILFDTGNDRRISVLSTLILSKAVTIRGPRGGDRMQLDGNGSVLVIQVPASATVTLQNLEITGGINGVANEGNLVVEDMTFSGNTTSNFGRGGAISNSGTLAARDSLFVGNSGYNGGAVAADGPATTVERCTFEANTTTGNSGAAIVGSNLQVVNSTFSANETTGADRVGGAIALFSDDPTTCEIAFSTLADNVATGSGGGIYVAGAVTLTLRSSILSGNAGPGGGPDLMALGAVVAEYNVLSSGTDSGLTDGLDGNVIGETVGLAPLFDNGGTTPTRLPDAESSSTDLVPEGNCTDLEGAALATDQRGTQRPSGEACDSGAVELD